MTWYVPYYSISMSNDLDRLRSLLDSTDPDTVGTSIRLPVALRDAAALAAELGLARSVTGLTVEALRADLEAVLQRAALQEHYAAHPDLEPSLAEVALARAELDGDALAERPDLIDRAATEVLRRTPEPTVRDVLHFAAGMATAAA
jgi:hypothetical protein